MNNPIPSKIINTRTRTRTRTRTEKYDPQTRYTHIPTLPLQIRNTLKTQNLNLNLNKQIRSDPLL